MRLLRSLLLTLTLISSYSFAQEPESDSVHRQKHAYQSDVTRLRRIVINSLYSHRDIFLRELLSNANDALEKLRIISLTDKHVWDGTYPLNITIKAVKNDDGNGGRIIISDTGIGMTADELKANLGTLAKSGTTEFLQKVESDRDGTNRGNLIGSFGLGFYSSFLVADKVYVASLAAKSNESPNPIQYVFSSSADDGSFEVYPDPRGNTLGCGTEITLVLKEDAFEYLDTNVLQDLVRKHSVFSTSFPIYLNHQYEKDVPIEEQENQDDTKSTSKGKSRGTDGDEVIVEEIAEEDQNVENTIKYEKLTVEEWTHLNSMPPIWLRDPKDVTNEEYSRLYESTFRDYKEPLAWHHFSGDTGFGVSFKAILFIPSHLNDNFWQEPSAATKDIRLMVKRVFVTNELGSDDPLPKWASWVKVIIDADDLPLSVSRETLQQTRFLKQIKQIIVKRLIQLFAKIAEEEPEKFQRIHDIYSSAIKLGVIENKPNREKLAALARYNTNQRNDTTLDQYLKNRKKGQRQIFYLADVGKSIKVLKKSVFVEKLDARGYEVLLLNEPLDEVIFQHLNRWKNIPFQDVAKAGLKFGDEDLESEGEKEQQDLLAERFKPLLSWLKVQAGDVVRDVIISNRLVTSPCAIVADHLGMTANVEKLMNAASKRQPQSDNDFMRDFARKQKVLEINPKSPLIEGLLRRVELLPVDEEPYAEAEVELAEVATILIDGALVRSGFDVPDSDEFFSRVDRVLRRSLGVSETAKANTSVRPAPPIESEIPTADPPAGGSGMPQIVLPDELKDHLQIELEPMPDDEPIVTHDEL